MHKETIMNPFIFSILVTIGLIIIILISISVPMYFSSCVSARIYNQRNNASYTCSDFFWAQSQINSQTATINLKQ